MENSRSGAHSGRRFHADTGLSRVICNGSTRTEACVCRSAVAAQSRFHRHGDPHVGVFHRREHCDFFCGDALLLKSLLYSHPERMGTIYTRFTAPFVSDERHHLNGEQWELLRDNVPSLTSAVAVPRAFATGGDRQPDIHAQVLPRIQSGRSLFG